MSFAVVRIAIVAALSRNRVISKNGRIPWKIEQDLMWFREQTIGRPVVMGRKTFDSIGKPLSKRTNIVLTRNRDLFYPGVLFAESLEAGLKIGAKIARSDRVDELSVIGGGEVYSEAIPLASKAVLTEIDLEVDGDTFFPPLSPLQWLEVSRVSNTSEAGLGFDFVIYERI